MTLFTASLYLLCLAALFGSALFVYSRNPKARLNACYALLALALLAWVGTLFVFGSLPQGQTLLLIGRANFAAAALVAATSCLFVAELAGRELKFLRTIWLETALMVLLSLTTPLIDRAETVLNGQHQTAYGTLFALYVVHVVAYLAGAVILAFLPPPGRTDRTRQQLRLVGTGILATATVGVTANIVLPYGYGDFRFIHVGTLSTILLLIAVAYAVFVHHLFSIRVIVRKTLVYAALISIALEVYQVAVGFLADLLPFSDAAERHFAATAIALVVHASTQASLRAWLEDLVERGMTRKRNMTGKRTRRSA